MFKTRPRYLNIAVGKNSRLSGRQCRSFLRSCSVDSDGNKAVFRTNNLCTVSVTYPQIRLLATPAEEARLAQSLARYSWSSAYRYPAAMERNYCKDYLHRQHATNFRVFNLISSFDLRLSFPLPIFLSLCYWTNNLWNILLPSAKLSLNQEAYFR